MMDIFDIKGIKPMLIADQVDPYDDPELGNIYKYCQKKCILDGELNVLVNGKPNFYETQKRTLLSDPFKIQLSYTKYPANFVAYDILYYQNRIITDLPLIERKKILSDVILENNFLSISRYIETNGKALFQIAMSQHLEGVVGKKKNSLYWFDKRTKEWTKVKVMADYEAIAVAYISKPNNMTSLVLAKYDESNNLIITNHVTLGVSLTKLKQQGLKLSKCPFLKIPKGYDNAVWIKPIVCTIEYMPSEKGGLRQAVYKLPEECRLDKIGE